MKGLRSLTISLVVCLLSHGTMGQDAQFSQFYAAPLYLNPAFAGSIEMSRFGFNQRIQWPALAQTIKTSSAYIDHAIQGTAHGFGAIAVRHEESIAKLSYTYVGLQYSHMLELSGDWVFRMGVEGRVFQKDADFEELVFSNQIDIVSGTVSGSSGEFFEGQWQRRGFDLGAGGLLFSNNSWIGASVYHLTQPDDSFVDNDSKIPRFISFHAGHKFFLKQGGRLSRLEYSFQERSVTLAANYKTQGPFAQMDIGFQTFLEPIYAGIWYRGIPAGAVGTINRDESVILLAGIQLRSGLNIGYSYDITVSELRGSTGGSHEISISMLFGNSLKRRRGTKLPCFYTPNL